MCLSKSRWLHRSHLFHIVYGNRLTQLSQHWHTRCHHTNMCRWHGPHDLITPSATSSHPPSDNICKLRALCDPHTENNDPAIQCTIWTTAGLPQIRPTIVNQQKLHPCRGRNDSLGHQAQYQRSKCLGEWQNQSCSKSLLCHERLWHIRSTLSTYQHFKWPVQLMHHLKSPVWSWSCQDQLKGQEETSKRYSTDFPWNVFWGYQSGQPHQNYTFLLGSSPSTTS